MRWRSLALVTALMLALGGCYESTTPAHYEPGVYKGKHDPLLDKLQQDEGLQAELEQRFQTAAQDR